MPDTVFVGTMAYNGGSYLTSAISTSRISLDISNTVDKTGRNWCGSCAVCYEYVIIADSFFMGKTNEANATPICYCTESPNEVDLIQKINLISITRGAGTFSTLATAMDWVRSQGLFVTNQNYPTITTLNHVLFLDAGLTASYPNQGTNWWNMATSSNNATLNGGHTWVNTDMGYLDFNGSTGYASFASTSSIPTGNNTYTINVWFNPDSRTGTDGLIGWGGYGTNNAVNAIKLTSTGIQNVWGGNDLTVTTTINTGQWYNVVATFDGTTRSLYLNGSLIGSDTPVGHNVTTSSNLTVARTDAAEYFDGKISLVQILPSALNSSEISLNYTKFSTRYDGSYTQICRDPLDIFFCNSPTPTPSAPTPTPTITPPPTPQLLGQCIDVTSNETGVIFLDYKRRDGTQACQPIGQGSTIPVCVYPGEGGNIESWDGFPCEGPNNLLPISAISIVPIPYGCINAGECIDTSLNMLTLSYDEGGYFCQSSEDKICQSTFSCGGAALCVAANKT